MYWISKEWLLKKKQKKKLRIKNFQAVKVEETMRKINN